MRIIWPALASVGALTGLLLYDHLFPARLSHTCCLHDDGCCLCEAVGI